MKILTVLALSAAMAGAALLAAGPTQAATTTNQTISLSELGADAQSIYTPEQVGVSRRNFRAQCTTKNDADYCECLTAGYAQALTPPEVDLASAMISGKAKMKARAMAAFSTPEARDAAAMHIEEAAATFGQSCHAPAP